MVFVVLTDINYGCLQSSQTVNEIIMVLIAETLCGSSRTIACCTAGEASASWVELPGCHPPVLWWRYCHDDTPWDYQVAHEEG